MRTTRRQSPSPPANKRWGASATGGQPHEKPDRSAHAYRSSFGAPERAAAPALVMSRSWPAWPGVILLASSARLIWPAIHILLEGTPEGLDLVELERSIQGAPGVLRVHDIHAWALTSGYNAVTAHVVLSEDDTPGRHEAVLDHLRHLLPARFPVRHLTIQLEESSNCCNEAHLPEKETAAPAGKDTHTATLRGGKG